MFEILHIYRRHLRCLLLTALLPALAYSQDSPQELVARADAFRQPVKEGLMVFATSIHREGESVVEATHEVRAKGRDRALVLSVAGRDKGQRVLMNADNLWVRLPSSSRALRITPMQKLMGDVSYGDLGRLSWADDYTATFHTETREELVEGTDAWRLRLVSRSASATYPQIDLWLAKTDSRPLLAKFYLDSGKLLKFASFGSLEVLDGRKIVREVVYRDMLNLKTYSVLRLQRYKAEQLADVTFNVQRFRE